MGASSWGRGNYGADTETRLSGPRARSQSLVVDLYWKNLIEVATGWKLGILYNWSLLFLGQCIAASGSCIFALCHGPERVVVADDEDASDFVSTTLFG